MTHQQPNQSTSTIQPILQAQQLDYAFTNNDTQIHILNDLALTILPGEQVAIIGSSGSGKSTLLSLLAGLDVPTRGEVQILGAPFSALDEDGRAAVRAANMGFVFQSFQLLPALTALENVMLPLQLTNIQQQPDKALRERAEAVLSQVGLGHRLHHYPKQLSGGEQQRVAIARAFASQPRILFADEPTGNLDHATGQMIIQLLFDLNTQHGTTLILVTHDIQLANRCQRSLTLADGKLTERQAS